MPTYDQTVVLARQHPDHWPATDHSSASSEASRPRAADNFEERSSAVGRLAWIAPAVLMLCLGLIRLSWPALWADEFVTWGMATAAWDQMIPVLRYTDAVIGPYYLLIRAWAELFGASEFALRLPSVLAMVGAVALTARVGTKLAGARVGFVAGLILALLPSSSRFAQEARPYAFAVFAACLATLVFLRLLDKPSTSRMFLYAASVALIGFFHVVALVLLVAHGMTLLFVDRKALVRWMIATGIGILPMLPLLLLGRRQQAQISWIPDPTLDRVIKLPEGVFGNALIGGLIVGLFLIAFSFRKPAIAPTMWAIAPPVALFAVSQVSPMLIARYLLFTAPAWALLAGLALRRAPVIRGIAVVAAIAVIGIPSQNGVRTQAGHSQGSRDVGALINTYAEPGDAVIFGPASKGEASVGRDIVAYYVSPGRLVVDPLLETPARTAGKFMPVECADVHRCFGDPARVWVVRVGTYDNPLWQLGKTKEEILSSSYSIQTVWRPTGLTIALLVKKAE